MIGIYKVINPKNKIYIGQSTDILKRFNDYKRLHCRSQELLYYSLKKYGAENHTFEIITECDIEDLNRLERYYQELYNVLDKDCGLNLKLTSYDDKSGYYSNESKEKISNTLKRKYQSGELMPPNKGKIFSEESKRKMSENHHTKKEGYVSPNLGKKMDCTPYWLGKNHSDETKKIIGDKNRGKIRTEEVKMKIRESHVSKKAGYVNPNAKMVIDLETGFVYSSAKEAWECNQDYLKITYRAFFRKLTGESKIKTKFQYI